MKPIKIKAMVYHSFEEGEALERKLMAEIPVEERLAKWNALADVFAKKVKNYPPGKNEGENSCLRYPPVKSIAKAFVLNPGLGKLLLPSITL